jgi:hypothetical protein
MPGKLSVSGGPESIHSVRVFLATMGGVAVSHVTMSLLYWTT